MSEASGWLLDKLYAGLDPSGRFGQEFYRAYRSLCDVYDCSCTSQQALAEALRFSARLCATEANFASDKVFCLDNMLNLLGFTERPVHFSAQELLDELSRSGFRVLSTGAKEQAVLGVGTSSSLEGADLQLSFVLLEDSGKLLKKNLPHDLIGLHCEAFVRSRVRLTQLDLQEEGSLADIASAEQEGAVWQVDSDSLTQEERDEWEAVFLAEYPTYES